MKFKFNFLFILFFVFLSNTTFAEKKHSSDSKLDVQSGTTQLNHSKIVQNGTAHEHEENFYSDFSESLEVNDEAEKLKNSSDFNHLNKKAKRDQSRGLNEKEAAGTKATNGLKDPIPKSKYSYNGQILEVDPD